LGIVRANRAITTPYTLNPTPYDSRSLESL